MSVPVSGLHFRGHRLRTSLRPRGPLWACQPVATTRAEGEGSPVVRWTAGAEPGKGLGGRDHFWTAGEPQGCTASFQRPLGKPLSVEGESGGSKGKPTVGCGWFPLPVPNTGTLQCSVLLPLRQGWPESPPKGLAQPPAFMRTRPSAQSSHCTCCLPKRTPPAKP